MKTNNSYQQLDSNKEEAPGLLGEDDAAGAALLESLSLSAI